MMTTEESIQHALSGLKPLSDEQIAAKRAEQERARLQATTEDLKTRWNAPERHLRAVVKEDGDWGRRLAEMRLKLGTGCLIVLYGAHGNGKTQLGVELMRYQIEQRVLSARFTSTTEFFMAVKSSYRKDSAQTEADIVDEFVKPKLLVIDELEKRGQSDWENNLLFHLINRRYNAILDTVMISNLPPVELSAHLGAALVSRLNETGGMIHCDWPSRR